MSELENIASNGDLKRVWSNIDSSYATNVSKKLSAACKELSTPNKRSKIDANEVTVAKNPDTPGEISDDGKSDTIVDQDGADDDSLVEEVEECDDDVSDISDLSDLSEEGWSSVAGTMQWIQQQMSSGTDPRLLLQQLTTSSIPSDIDDLSLWKVIVNILTEPPPRKKLENVNTLDDVIHLLKTCSRIVVLTGAGVSVSCGIPDFRSNDGIYSRLAVEYPDLPDPQAMFDIHYFERNQGPFFKFAKEIYPGQFTPSLCHRFIKLLDDQDKLLRNYTQNIDTLEQVAGIKNVIECHGSFATATCMKCDFKTSSSEIKEDIMNQVIPKCTQCVEDAGIMKPDIVFFGESLPAKFHRQMELDKDVCDLLIVIGSSLKVRPVALVPNSLPADVPQILINRERLHHLQFDVELLGDCDVIVNDICRRLSSNYTSLCSNSNVLKEVGKDDLLTPPNSGNNSPSNELHSDFNSDLCCNNETNASTKTDEMMNNNEVSSQASHEGTEPCNLQSIVPSLDSEVINYTDERNCLNSQLVSKKSPDNASNKADEKMNNNEVSSQASHEGTEPCNLQSIAPSLDSEVINHTDERNCLNSQLVSKKSPDKDHERSKFKKIKYADLLPEKSYLFLPPNRYIFSNAEVYEGDHRDDEDDEDDIMDNDTEDVLEHDLSAHPKVETSCELNSHSTTVSSNINKSEQTKKDITCEYDINLVNSPDGNTTVHPEKLPSSDNGCSTNCLISLESHIPTNFPS